MFCTPKASKFIFLVLNSEKIADSSEEWFFIISSDNQVVLDSLNNIFRLFVYSE